jgi:hypothetical protein
MRRHRRSGIPATVNSTLVLVALASSCVSAVALAALLKGWRDPTWTPALKATGFLCSGFCFLLGLVALGIVVFRMFRKP